MEKKRELRTGREREQASERDRAKVGVKEKENNVKLAEKNREWKERENVGNE